MKKRMSALLLTAAMVLGGCSSGGGNQQAGNTTPTTTAETICAMYARIGDWLATAFIGVSWKSCTNRADSLKNPN